jgi:hypothetical protein
MGPNETTWLALSASTDQATADKSLAGAMTAYQSRYGFLPDGYAYQEWEDVYAAASAALKII